jgi:hypothetical protein
MAIDGLFTRLKTFCSILCPLLSTALRLSPRRDCGHDQGVSAMQFTHKKNRSLYIPYAGPVLLEFPLLNKGSAFSMEERSSFNLLGLLPEVVETIEEQAERAWIQYQGFKTEIDKHIYLRNIQDTNETFSIA